MSSQTATVPATATAAAPRVQPASAAVAAAGPLQAGFDPELFTQFWEEGGFDSETTRGYFAVVAPRASVNRAGLYTLNKKGTSEFPGSEMDGARRIAIPTGTSAEAALAQILPLIDDRTQSVYIKLNVFNNLPEDKPGRVEVTKRHARNVRGFFMDLDCAGGAHVEGDLPSRETAEAFIAQLPVAPTMVTWTGGGFHLFFMLEEAFDADDTATGEAIASGMKHTLLEYFDRAGRGKADTGPTSDYLARWTRVPGFMNGKRPDAPQLVDLIDAGSPITVADMLAAFPAPARPTPAAAADPATRAPLPNAQRAGQGARPGDRFASSVTVTWVAGLLGAQMVGADKMRWPREDGTCSGDPSVKIFSDDDDPARDRLHAFSKRVTAAIKARVADPQRAESMPPQFSSFDLLAWAFCQGDYSLAARIVQMNEDRASGWFDLDKVAQVVTTSTYEELRSRFPKGAAKLQAVPDLTVESDVAEAAEAGETMTPVIPLPTAMRLEDAVLAGIEAMVPIPGPDKLLAMVSPHPERTGIFYHNRDNAKDPVGEQIADWIAIPIIRRSTRLVATGPSSRATRTVRGVKGDPDDQIDVMVIVEDGRREILEGLTLAEYNSLPGIVRIANLPISMPNQPFEQRLVASAHQRLRDTQARPQMRFRQTGYVELEPGRAAYIARGGSVDARGLRADLLVETGGEEQPLQVMEEFGFRTPPADPAVAAKLLAGMLAIGQMRIMLPILGETLAGFVPCGGSKGTLIVAGSTDSGKSWATAVANAMIGLGYSQEAFAASLANGSTGFGLEGLGQFFRDAPLAVDDYNQSGGDDPAGDAKATAGLKRFVQMSYSGAPAIRGSKSGDIKTTAPASYTGIVSAETAPTQASVRNRSAVVEVRKGDMDTLRDDLTQSHITAFRRLSQEHDASQIVVIVLQWILHLIETEGFAAVGERYKLVRDQYQAIAAKEGLRSRSVEVCTTFVAGIVALRDALEHRGPEWVAACAPHLPSDDALREIFLALAIANTASVEDESVARRTVRELAHRVSRQRAHLNFTADFESGLTTHQMPEPDQAEMMGWKRIGPEFQAQGEPIGFRSRDGRFVHVTRAAVAQIRTDLKLGISAQAHEAYLKEIAVRIGRPSSEHFPEGTGNRVPGYTIEAAVFYGFGAGEDD
ncbi:MAG: hypothetical protein ACTHZ9_05900 [Leucobacter sp.]